MLLHNGCARSRKAVLLKLIADVLGVGIVHGEAEVALYRPVDESEVMKYLVSD